MNKPYFALFFIVIILSRDVNVLSRTIPTKLQGKNLLAIHTQAPAQVTKDVIDKASAATEVISGALSAWSDPNSPVSKIAGALRGFAKLGSALGALGFIAGLVTMFFPERDKFADILNRLDQLESRITNLISSQFAATNLQNAKSSLNAAEDQILSASYYLNQMQKTKGGADFGYFNNQFVRSMDNGGLASLDTLFQATTSTYFQASFPEQIINFTNGNGKALAEATKALLNLLITASVNYFAYLNIKAPNDVSGFAKDFDNRFNNVINSVSNLDDKCFNVALTYLTSNYQDLIKEKCDADNNQKSNDKCADNLFKHYTGMYNGYLYFAVFAYDPDEGYEFHSFGGPSTSYYYSKQFRNRNVVVFWQKQLGCRPVSFSPNQLLDVMNSNSKGSQKCMRMVTTLNNVSQRFFVKKNSDLGWRQSYAVSTTSTNSDYFGWAANVAESYLC